MAVASTFFAGGRKNVFYLFSSVDYFQWKVYFGNFIVWYSDSICYLLVYVQVYGFQYTKGSSALEKGIAVITLFRDFNSGNYQSKCDNDETFVF